MTEKIRLRFDPYNAGIRAYERGEDFDPDFGRRCKGWGPISAQLLYEKGRLQAANGPPSAGLSKSRPAPGKRKPNW